MMIKKLLAQGYSHQAIADIEGCSRSRVTQLANNQGTRKQQTVLTDTQWAELLAQYPTCTITWLAHEYNISRAAIYARIKS